jgi:hypothetical protein
MPFTAEELLNISNSVIDFHLTSPEVMSQTIQDKPLLKALKGKQKMFPGGKEFITARVKGEYVTETQGFSHDDTVSYQRPAKIKQVKYQWKEVHWGISFTGTELKHEGLSIVDSLTGEDTSEHSQREKFVLAGLLKDKVEDMTESSARGMNDFFWRDGSQDPKLPPGVLSFILNDPTSATVVGGIDQSIHTWWRNRAALSLSTSTPSDLTIAKRLSKERRQLIRYGGKPNLFLAGSDFLDALEAELRSKGDYTQDGWAKGGRIDMSVADMAFKGQAIDYDPTLDDLGLAKYGYWIDTNVIYPMVMEGEDMKRHAPARPEDKYVYYRAITWTGGMVCRRRNSSLVISIA